MVKNKKTQRYIEEELPYQILMHIYENSRAPLRELGRKLGISYHVIARVLKKYEEQYKIVYTLDLDPRALGFSEGRLITVKFNRMPDLDWLTKKLKKDIFVQDAYIAEGDFSLLLFVVGLSPDDFQFWQFKFRMDMAKYAPRVNFSNVNISYLGFLPLRNELIEKSEMITSAEKKVLTVLNGNSRVRLNDLVHESGLSYMRTIYILKKLQDRGIIKRFSALTQRPDKRLYYAYGMTLIPVEHHELLSVALAEETLREDLHSIVNDYGLTLNTNGTYDLFDMCAFDAVLYYKNGVLDVLEC